MYVLWLEDNITTKATLLDLIMLKLSSVPMSILNLRVWEKGKLANKWKTTFCSVMKEKDKYKKTPIIFKLFFFY